MIIINSGATNTEFPTVLYRNYVASAALSGAGTATGNERENLLGPQTYDYWSPTTQSGSFFATWAAPVTLDMVAIAAHNLHVIGSGLRVNYSPDLTTAYQNICLFSDAQMVANGAGPVACIFPAIAVQRLQIFAPALSGAPSPQIGVLFAGQRLTFPGWIAPPYVQAEDARTVETNAAQSLGGHYLQGAIRRKAMRQTAQISAVDRAWADGDLVPFARAYDAGDPFFWAGAPAFLTRDLSYAWRPDDAPELRPQVLAGGARVGLTLELAGYGA